MTEAACVHANVTLCEFLLNDFVCVFSVLFGGCLSKRLSVY